MDGELRLTIGGFSITVSKANAPTPSASTERPDQPRPLPQSSSSSFELVDLPASSSAAPYAAPFEPVPCPLPARSSGLDLGQASTPISSPLRVPEYPLQGPLRPRSEIFADFPELPLSLRDTCRHLSGGKLTWEATLRAWEAGCWARAVLAAEVASPNHSAPLALQNRFYCILAAPDLTQPTVVRSFAEYKAIVGTLSPGKTLSHAFPSESESRVYFAGARRLGPRLSCSGSEPGLDGPRATARPDFQDPLLDAPASSTSVRGALGRQKLQGNCKALRDPWRRGSERTLEDGWTRQALGRQISRPWCVT